MKTAFKVDNTVQHDDTFKHAALRQRKIQMQCACAWSLCLIYVVGNYHLNAHNMV